MDLDPELERLRLEKLQAKEERRKLREAKQLARSGMMKDNAGKETMSINFQFGSTTAGRAIEKDIMLSRMNSDITFETANGAPMIMITRALYGHKTDLSKAYSVTTKIQNMVIGRRLVLDNSMDMNLLFGDPTPGARKWLQIEYTALGFLGNLRVKERDGNYFIFSNSFIICSCCVNLNMLCTLITRLSRRCIRNRISSSTSSRRMIYCLL
jgi:hypothetical protein